MKIGIDVGGSHIAIGVIDNQNNLIEKHEKDFSEKDKLDILNVIENFTVETIKKIENKFDIENIGIAVPGTTKNGVILRTVNLGINNYNIAKSLEEKLNKTITVKNDGKCACIAEFENMKKNGSVKKDANMVFLNIGTGIGGGVIYNGKLLEGHSFDGFEFGHIIIKENGLPCKCGKSGCFERYGSILEFKNKVKQRLDIPQEINSQPLRDIMDKNIDKIIDIENEYISDLAIGISNIINIFEPDVLVIGGGFTHFGYMFEKKLKNAIINSNLLFNKREDIDLRLAQLGNDAGIIGATLSNFS